MSTIENTVNRALDDNGLATYRSHARPVIDRLVAREVDMSDQLIAAAKQQGLDEAEAAALLREIGMTMREPRIATLASADAQNQAASDAPSHRAEGDDDLTAALARINDTLEDLAGFARQNGWRPTR